MQEQIHEIKRANHPISKIKFTPIADLLVSDGEVPLVRYMGQLTKDSQLCTWYLAHDLHPLLKYKYEASSAEARGFTSQLAGIIDIKLPAEDFEKVGLEDRLTLERSTLHGLYGGRVLCLSVCR